MYVVDITETAQRVYERVYAEAEACRINGDLTNSKVDLLRWLDDAIDTELLHDPFCQSRSLEGVAALYQYSGSKLRIGYTGSKHSPLITILYICDTLRKEGRASDPHSELMRMIRTGQIDHVFDKLGLREPQRRAFLQVYQELKQAEKPTN